MPKINLSIEISDEDINWLMADRFSLIEEKNPEPVEVYLQQILVRYIKTAKRHSISGELSRICLILNKDLYDLETEGNLLIIERLKKEHPLLNSGESQQSDIETAILDADIIR
ncbi:MAG: hypothetical protein M3367_03320 [Acidobacteriota bacterium]|nr:hypothetical protein [Acidobacteriota bacterium]